MFDWLVYPFVFYKLKVSLAFGAGKLRYLLDNDEKINICVDIGFGKDTMGFYFGMEEAF